MLLLIRCGYGVFRLCPFLESLLTYNSLLPESQCDEKFRPLTIYFNQTHKKNSVALVRKYAHARLSVRITSSTN